MKKTLILLTLLCGQSVLLAAAPLTMAERQAITDVWMQENPESLPHWLTPQEYEIRDDIGRNFYPTDPPTGPVRNIAEFETMQGVLIRYPFGIPMSLIHEMAEDDTVYTLVSSSYQENTVRSQYTSNGVNLDHCRFIIAPTDSYWSRDYGPWFAADGDGEIGIVNFPYNRPRPNDDDIPIEVADYLEIPLYGMDLEHTGGNYMTDGMGISASSELVWEENPGLSHQDVADLMNDYLGIHTYHVVPDPNNTYIDHIDCWGKFLDVDKVLIRSVPTYHAQYDEIEATADYFAAQTSSYGTPFQVFRVYTPNNQPYTNSLILNHKVFVPVTGSGYDDDALATYEAAMPGYEVIGFSGSWESTDALHCRTKGIADLGMLYLRHIPLHGDLPEGSDCELSVEVTASSGAALISDSMRVTYRLNGGAWQEEPLTDQGSGNWTAEIAAADGDAVDYYLCAADESGRSARHPLIGAADPHHYISCSTALPAPQNLMITISGNQVNLNWDAVTDATHYQVYQSVSPLGPFTPAPGGIVTGTSWQTGLNSTELFYRVTALD